jgi:hypothetical protein
LDAETDGLEFEPELLIHLVKPLRDEARWNDEQNASTDAAGNQFKQTDACLNRFAQFDIIGNERSAARPAKQPSERCKLVWLRGNPLRNERWVLSLRWGL